jgi:hypothetical protein
MVLFEKLDFENWICIQQTEIAETLHMQRPHVSRAIGILERKGSSCEDTGWEKVTATGSTLAMGGKGRYTS